MSHADDRHDLPPRGANPGTEITRTPPVTVYPVAQPARTALTAAQVDRVIEGGLRVTEGLLDIGREFMSIARLRAETDHDVAILRERTQSVVQRWCAAVPAIDADARRTRTRGEQAVAIIRAMRETILAVPDGDEAARQAAIEGLPEIIAMVLGPARAAADEVNIE